MKDILSKEEVFNIIEESINISNVNDFIEQLRNHWSKNYKTKPEKNKLENLLNKIREDIIKSGCENVEFKPFTMRGIAGASLKDGVVLNIDVISQGSVNVIFALFHEIAHQYQFKKYGNDLSFKIYNTEIEDKDELKSIINWLKEIESVADRFGINKVNEYKKLDLIYGELPPVSDYEGATDDDILNLISYFKRLNKTNNVKTSEDMDEVMFNWLIRKV